MPWKVTQVSRKYCDELDGTKPTRRPFTSAAPRTPLLPRAMSLIWCDEVLVVPRMARSWRRKLASVTASSAAVATWACRCSMSSRQLRPLLHSRTRTARPSAVK